MKKKSFILIISLLFVFFAVGFLIFSENGLINYLNLKSKVNSLNTRIEKLEKENEALSAEIDSLKLEIPEKIERTARERYNMKKPGEVKIEIKDEKE